MNKKWRLNVGQMNRAWVIYVIFPVFLYTRGGDVVKVGLAKNKFRLNRLWLR